MQPLNEFEHRELLVRTKLNEADPIWGQIGHVYDTFAGWWIVTGDRCGNFACSPTLRASLQGWSEAARARLTSWIVDQNRVGVRFPPISPDVLSDAFSGRSMRFSRKVDRLFQYLALIGHRPGDFVVSSGVETTSTLAAKHAIMRWIEATNEMEFYGLIEALKADGLLIADSRGAQLTARGFNRLDDVDSAGAANDQAFVAMWFDATMEAAFEEGIEPGLADAGYRAFRIDRKEHANKIDDEIVAEIRRSRFIVADFTCGVTGNDDTSVGIPRGGVYYEAGFAQGLGMPVIWTVRTDQIGLVHFDTRQFNHITWTEPADLRTRIYQRVAAVIGEFRAGP